MLHIGGKSKLKQLRTLDWMGIFLFTAGLVVFLIGLNWGGSSYPWKSGHVLGALFGGFFTLVIFCLWEAFAGLEYPLIPMRLFKNIQYDANVACASFGAVVYYANTVIWPTMIGALFTTDIKETGWLSVSSSSVHHPHTLLTSHSAQLAVASSSAKSWAASASASFPA